MFTVTGKVCLLGAVFMIGLVFLWLCHVCCRTIWRAILVRLESSSRFSRILELSEINRERLRILPPAGAPVTHLAFLTTYVSSSARPTTVTTHFSRYNRDRLRSRPPPTTSGLANGTAHAVNEYSSSRVANGTNVIPRSVPSGDPTTEHSWDRARTFVRQDTQSTCGGLVEPGFVPPSFLSIDLVGSEPMLDTRQSTTLTIASANSPPPSYHSTESIMSQPASLHSHRDRVFREFPRQTSDSSETSTQSAPPHIAAVQQLPPLSRRERLQKIAEQHGASTASSSSAVGNELSNVVPSTQANRTSDEVSTASNWPVTVDTVQPSQPDDLPPSYEELFGQTT